MTEPDFEDFEYAEKRLSDRLYISKRIGFPGGDLKFRFAHKRLEDAPLRELVKEGQDFVLYETPTGIQQIKAKFVEDGRGITHLYIQRWSTKTDRGIGSQVVLYGEQISKLLEFIDQIRRVEIPTAAKFNRSEAELRLVHLPDEEARRLLRDKPNLIADLARSQVTTEDVVALAYRREQLDTFSSMLDRGSDCTEADWQSFFERNRWIFGYGLSYVFTTGLDGRALQQTLRGSSIVAPGRIPDGIMKTRAAVSALCLVEIKKSSTDLLRKNEYRSGTWAASAELSGAVAQCQEALRTAAEVFGSYHRFTDDHGNPTDEELMSVEPRAFLVIGSLAQFQTDRGVNAARYKAFEGFRRNLRQPEVLTFDELYERARFIVEHAENVRAPEEGDPGDIPF